MRKYILQLALFTAAIYLLMSTSIAQSIFFNNNAQNSQTNYQQTSGSNDFARNFANQVKSMNKHLQSESSQAIQDSMAAVKIPAPTAPAAPTSAMPSSLPSAPQSQPAYAEPMASSPMTPPPAPVNRPPVYTGFGTDTPGTSNNSNSNTTTSAPAGNNNGGWNINY